MGYSITKYKEKAMTSYHINKYKKNKINYVQRPYI